MLGSHRRTGGSNRSRAGQILRSRPVYIRRGGSEDAIVTKTVTNESGATMQKRQIEPEGAELLEEVSGGAGRVRTAASQFCRLLP